MIVALCLAAITAQGIAAPAAKKRPQIVPESLIGEWATDLATCKEHYAEGRLTVEGNSMLFHASLYDVRRTDKLPDGSLKLSGLRSEEGEGGRPTRDSIKLKILSPNRFELIDHPEGQFYERCKKPAG